MKPHLDYSSNIFLHSGEDTRFQFVYGSQLYGTFFGLFAKFKFDIDSSKQSANIKRIDFELINYKGILNIEIESIDVYPNYEEIETKNDVLYIDLFVKAGIGDHKPTIGYTKEFSKSIKVTNGSYFSIYRTLLPLKSDSDSDQNTYKNVYDSEFHERDGKISGLRKLAEFPDLFKYQSKDENDKSLASKRIASIRCQPSNNKIIIM